MLPLMSALGLTLPLAAGVSQEVQAVVAANNQFALDLYSQLQHRDGNLLLSPYSINKVLAMTYAGARGDTEKEMAAVLHFTLGQDRQHRAFLETRRLLNHGASALGLPNPLRSSRAVQLYLTANLWGQRGYGSQESFLNLVHEYYGGGLQELDFGATEQARKTINDYVQNQTFNAVQQLLQPGTINATTRLVLTSGVYFKGDWARQFKKGATRSEPFWITGSSRASVPMMRQIGTFGYFEDADLQVLQMPYFEGNGLAMVVLLPNNKERLADLEQALTAQRIETWMARLHDQKVNVSMPKFRLIIGLSLNETLMALGMRKAFTGAADFSGMNAGQEPLFISEVMHKAFVDVNEEGTEAAAATGAAVATISMAPVQPRMPVFRADHPFVFAIRDVRTGVILFLGRVVKP